MTKHFFFFRFNSFMSKNVYFKFSLNEIDRVKLAILNRKNHSILIFKKNQLKYCVAYLRFFQIHDSVTRKLLKQKLLFLRHFFVCNIQQPLNKIIIIDMPVSLPLQRGKTFLMRKNSGLTNRFD